MRIVTYIHYTVSRIYRGTYKRYNYTRPPRTPNLRSSNIGLNYKLHHHIYIGLIEKIAVKIATRLQNENNVKIKCQRPNAS